MIFLHQKAPQAAILFWREKILRKQCSMGKAFGPKKHFCTAINIFVLGDIFLYCPCWPPYNRGAFCFVFPKPEEALTTVRKPSLAKPVEAVLTSPSTPVQESRVWSFVLRASLSDTLLFFPARHENWFPVVIVLGRILRYVFYA